MEYVLMIGIALSGKKTYRKANFEHEVIQLFYFGNDRKKEMKYIETCLKKGKDVVVDDTNLTLKIRKMHIDLAKKYNTTILGIFMNTSMGLLQQRRWKRHDQLDMVVINKQRRELETPTKEEGFDNLIIHKDYEK